jgi:hypothetical protein
MRRSDHLRIVFLDIEGVLNEAPWAVGQLPAQSPWPRSAAVAWRQRRLNPSCVERLRRLVEQTRASIVLTSDWRHRMSTGEFARLLALYGYEAAPVIGATPALVRAIRGEEVAAWRVQNQSTCSYVCLDDDADFLPDQPLVQTRPELGLTDDDVIRALTLLTGTGQ